MADARRWQDSMEKVATDLDRRADGCTEGIILAGEKDAVATQQLIGERSAYRHAAELLRRAIRKETP